MPDVILFDTICLKHTQLVQIKTQKSTTIMKKERIN